MASQYTKMDVKKEDYHAVSGASYGQEKHVGGQVVATQPQAVSGVENYILDLDAAQVSGEYFNNCKSYLVSHALIHTIT